MNPQAIGRFNSDAVTEMFEYLDDLRKDGVTNMFGATPYLQREFDGLDLSRDEAVTVLSAWMNSFTERHPSRVAGKADQ